MSLNLPRVDNPFIVAWGHGIYVNSFIVNEGGYEKKNKAQY